MSHETTIARSYTPPSGSGVSAIAVGDEGTVFFGLTDIDDMSSAPNARTHDEWDGLYRLDADGSAALLWTSTTLKRIDNIAVSATRVFVGARTCVHELRRVGGGVEHVRAIGNCIRDGRYPYLDGPPSWTTYEPNPLVLDGASGSPDTIDLFQIEGMFVHRDGSLYVLDDRGSGISGLQNRLLRYMPSEVGSGLVQLVRGYRTGEPNDDSFAVARLSSGGFVRGVGLGGMQAGLQVVDAEGNEDWVLGGDSTPGSGVDGQRGRTAYGISAAILNAPEGGGAVIREFRNNLFALELLPAYRTECSGSSGPTALRIVRLSPETGVGWAYVGAPLRTVCSEDSRIYQADDLGQVGAERVAATRVRLGGIGVPGCIDFDFRGDGTMFVSQANGIYRVEPGPEAGVTGTHRLTVTHPRRSRDILRLALQLRAHAGTSPS